MMKSFIGDFYFLKRDPFDKKVDLEAPIADREKQSKEWDEVIDRNFGKEGNSLNFIVGDYGLGKSLSLYNIVEKSREKSGILPIFMKFLPEDRISKFGLDFVQRIFYTLKLPSPKVDRKIEQPYHAKTFYKCLKNIPNEELSNELGRNFTGVADVFQRLKYGSQPAYEYIAGVRSLTRTELTKKLGVTHNISSSEEAKEYLIGLLWILKKAGIDTVVLTIDEVEYVFSQMKGNKIASVFNNLRDFYDLPQSPKVIESGLNLANIIFFFGISESGWNKLREHEKREATTGGPFVPFMDRLDKVITLDPLDKKYTRELIEFRLRFNRTEERYEDKPLIPFAEDFVGYVFELTGGNPRDIVGRCEYVLVDGLREEVEELNKEFAKKVFEAHRMTS